MADTNTTTQTQATTSTQAAFKMPDKFLNKSAEDIAKAYSELETKLGELGPKAKFADDYNAKIKMPDGRPATVDETLTALTWAREVKGMIDTGVLTKAQGKQALKEGPDGKTASVVADLDDQGIDWDTLTPGQMATKLRAAAKADAETSTKSIAADYEKRFTEILAQKDSQFALGLKAIKLGLKNPNADIDDIVAEAAKLSQLTPAELLDFALERKLAPGNSEASLKKQVDEQVQLELQRRDAEALKSITPSTGLRPRIVPTMKTREDENTKIATDLQKLGIRLT